MGNFHRWRKPFGMQESKNHTFDRLIWHLSDENGWNTHTASTTKYVGKVIRCLAHWGAHIPEDLDPDFDGEIEWGVNGREASYAANHCYGNLDLALAHAAVSAGRSLPRRQLVTALCSLSRSCPGLHSSLKFRILQFLYPQLGRGRLVYATLQRSEGGRIRIRGVDYENVVCSETSVPPRGYVCGRCREAGHWRQFCPKGKV